MVAQKVNFTKRLIEGFQSQGKRAYYRDSKVAGLILDLTPSGTKSFYIYRKVAGKPERIFIGRFPEWTVEQARTKASEINARIGKGENPQEDAREARNELTLAELFQEYIDRHAKKKRKTWPVMQKDFARNAASLSGLQLSQITHQKAEKLHSELGSHSGNYTANRTVQLLKAVLNKGKLWGLYDGGNPFQGISLFPEQARSRFLSNEEAGRLLKALQKSPANNQVQRTLRDFILLDLFTGARKSNLMSMRWDEVDFQAQTWTIPDEKSKNSTTQIVTLGQNELTILKERRNLQKRDGVISPFVFPGTGKDGHLTEIKRSWTTLRNRLEIEDVTIHDLRRSLAATMASKNVNVALIKSALHHKDIKTTINVYARTNKQAELDAKQSAHAVWFDAARKLSRKEAKPLDSDRKSRKRSKTKHGLV